jgi:hypothetical protein
MYERYRQERDHAMSEGCCHADLRWIARHLPHGVAQKVYATCIDLVG